MTGLGFTYSRCRSAQLLLLFIHIKTEPRARTPKIEARVVFFACDTFELISRDDETMIVFALTRRAWSCFIITIYQLWGQRDLFTQQATAATWKKLGAKYRIWRPTKIFSQNSFIYDSKSEIGDRPKNNWARLSFTCTEREQRRCANSESNAERFCATIIGFLALHRRRQRHRAARENEKRELGCALQTAPLCCRAYKRRVIFCRGVGRITFGTL